MTPDDLRKLADDLFLHPQERREVIRKAADEIERMRNHIFNALEDLTAPMADHHEVSINRAIRQLKKAARI